MSDPWKPQPKVAKVNFAQSEIVRIEKTASNGNTYYEMNIFLSPINPENDLIERRFFNFQPAWEKIVIPSVMNLVNQGKLTSPADMEKSQYVSYRWGIYKSYDNRDIEYWKEQNKDKLAVDDEGRTYKPHSGIEFLDVFTTEEEWHTAYEQAVEDGVSNGTTPTVSTVDTNTTDNQRETALSVLPILVKNNGTNIPKLKEALSHHPFDIFTINSDEVKDRVINMILAEEPDKQLVMVQEINSHFEEKYPYITEDDLEVPF